MPFPSRTTRSCHVAVQRKKRKKAVPGKPILMRDLVNLKEGQGLTVSPDGSFAIVSQSEADFEKGSYRYQLHFVDPVRRSSWQMTQSASAMAADPRLSPDGAWLAFIESKDRGMDEAEDDSDQIWLMHVAGGEAKRLTDVATGVLDHVFDGKGNGIWFIATLPPTEVRQAWANRDEDRSEDARSVHKDIPPQALWHVDQEGEDCSIVTVLDRGVGSFDMDPEGRRVVYSSNGTGISADADAFRIWLYDLKRKRRRLLCKRPGPQHGPRWSPDGKHVAFIANHEPHLPHSRSDLFVVDVRSGKWRCVNEELDRGVQRFAWGHDGKTLFATVQEGFHCRPVVFDLKGKLCRRPWKGDVCVSNFALASRAPVAMVMAEDANHGPELWRLDLTGKTRPRRGTDWNGVVEEWAVAPRRKVRWKGRDGMAHQGLLFEPTGGDPGPWPCIVSLHGGPHAPVSDRLQEEEYQAFAAGGYAVFVPCYRGTEGWGDAYGRANQDDLGGEDLHDVLTGIDALVEKGIIDDERVGVIGSSYGGYLVNLAIGKSHRFKAAVTAYGIFNLVTDFGTSAFPLWERKHLGAYYWENPQLYAERSPATYAKNVETPLLLFHGNCDGNTFLANALEAYQTLRSLGKTVDFVQYPREGHGWVEPGHQQDFVNRVLAWFDRWLGRPDLRTYRTALLPGKRLRIVGTETRESYGGRKAEGRFLEMTLALEARDGMRDELRLPLTGRHCIRLELDDGRQVRPLGLAWRYMGTKTLVEVRSDLVSLFDPKRPEAHGVAAPLVFDLPEHAWARRLLVPGFEPMPLLPRKDLLAGAKPKKRNKGRRRRS